MKKSLVLPLLLLAILSFVQKPLWLSDEARAKNYPHERYLTGFAINTGANTAAFAESLKASAKAELIENIQVSVQSEKTNQRSEINGSFNESYVATTLSFANADINGLRMEYCYDDIEKTGYAFAYADKQELQRYYKEKIAFTLQQVENTLNNAKQLEEKGNKGRAKKMYEEIKAYFKDLHFDQSLLIAIDNNDQSLQIEKTLMLESEIVHALARMQTAIVVCVRSSETNFGQQVHLLEPKLKALLSQQGCSYTNDPLRADWMLTIRAVTHRGHEVEGIFFSFLDVTISLIEQSTGKEIYSNNFANFKGGGLDYETAGRKAYDAGLEHIANEIVASLEK